MARSATSVSLRAILPLLLGGLLPLSGAGQIVDGRVVAEATEEPVQGVVAELLDDASAPVAAATTDEAGRFLLAAPEAGVFRLRARHIAYREVEAGPLGLDDDEAVEIVLKLSEDVLPLDPLEIVGRREIDVQAATLDGLRIRAARSPSVGPNRVLLRTDSEMRRWNSVEDVLRAISLRSGLHLAGARERARGSPRGERCPRIFRNGNELRRVDSLHFFRTTPVAYLEGIEYYRSHASAPAFVRHLYSPRGLARCGAVVVWIRHVGGSGGS